MPPYFERPVRLSDVLCIPELHNGERASAYVAPYSVRSTTRERNVRMNANREITLIARFDQGMIGVIAVTRNVNHPVADLRGVYRSRVLDLFHKGIDRFDIFLVQPVFPVVGFVQREKRFERVPRCLLL